MVQKALLLVDHGSRLPSANAQLADIAALVRERAMGEFIVAHAHMELARPTVAEAVTELVSRGVRDIALVPYFLARGRHVSSDLPVLAEKATALHPGVSIRIKHSLGIHDLLAELVLVRARE
jgi:sirohydrochlorin ferrochelatase